MTSVAHTRVCNALEGWAGRIPQTQIALRNAVTVNLGPVSGLASDFHLCDAFPHVVQWHKVAINSHQSELARLPLRGQCRTLTGFPFHPAGQWDIFQGPVFPGTQSNGPAINQKDHCGAASITVKSVFLHHIFMLHVVYPARGSFCYLLAGLRV